MPPQYANMLSCLSDGQIVFGGRETTIYFSTGKL